jgi:hypothetical protein
MGVTEPEATFSACYGGAFLMWHPMKYASMLAEKMKVGVDVVPFKHRCVSPASINLSQSLLFGVVSKIKGTQPRGTSLGEPFMTSILTRISFMESFQP